MTRLLASEIKPLVVKRADYKKLEKELIDAGFVPSLDRKKSFVVPIATSVLCKRFDRFELFVISPDYAGRSSDETVRCFFETELPKFPNALRALFPAKMHGYSRVKPKNETPVRYFAELVVRESIERTIEIVELVCRNVLALTDNSDSALTVNSYSAKLGEKHDALQALEALQIKDETTIRDLRGIVATLRRDIEALQGSINILMPGETRNAMEFVLDRPI